MAIKQETLLNAVTVTGAGAARAMRDRRATVHASGTTSAGAGAATIKVQGSSDGGLTWVDIGTITLTLATTISGDGFAIDAPWILIRGNVTAISGTTATVSLYLGN